MAAVLACGREAVASHHAAALLRGLRPTSRTAVDVTVPGRSRRGRRGIVVHSVRSLDRADRAVVDLIPVTSVARTILDEAEVLQAQQLANVVAEAERRRLFDLRELERTLVRNPGRRGIRPVRELMAAYAEPPITWSEAERTT
jgi:hypothetical protein